MFSGEGKTWCRLFPLTQCLSVLRSKRKSVEHDQRLFTLALLVSHFLVFVTRGAVDSDTLFSLASVSTHIFCISSVLLA